jgi:hypothetical protein
VASGAWIPKLIITIIIKKKKLNFDIMIGFYLKNNAHNFFLKKNMLPFKQSRDALIRK